MKFVIDTWLKGKRDYNMGIAIFSRYSTDKTLVSGLSTGDNLYNNWRLVEEMKKLSQELSIPAATDKKKKPVKLEKDTGYIILHPGSETKQTDRIPISPVHETALTEAKDLYKKAMNERAVLFSLVPADKYDNPNRPDLVDARKPHALNALKNFIAASDAFDKADEIEKNGGTSTATNDNPDAWKIELDKIPDIQISNKISNLRKNINKLSRRQPNQSRSEKIQEYTRQLEYLMQKWRSLQQQ